MQPTVGRIVYYKSRGSADGVYPSVDRAAIVTDIMNVPEYAENSTGSQTPGWKVKLTVFNPEGVYMNNQWIDQGQAGGQWDWMPFQKQNMGNQSASAEALGSNTNPATQSN